MRRIAWVAALGAGMALAGSTAFGQGAGSTGLGYSGTSGGAGMGMMPGVGAFANPYMNPAINPYAYSSVYGNSVPGGGVGAAWMFLGMRQAQAQAASARGGGNGRNATEGKTVPRGAMMRPGGGASRYFGGGSGEPIEARTSNPGARSGYFSRQDRYFRPNG